MAFQKVLREETLWSGEKLGIEVDGRRILLINLDGVVRAFEDRCAHQGSLLSRGKLAGHELTCGVHQWRYDATTGLGINPRGVSLRTYAVQILDGHILVDLDDR